METNSTSVLSASTNKQVWQIVQTNFPDMIIANVTTPIPDNYERSNSIEATLATASLTVVLLTSKGAYDSLLNSLCQGAVDYITQPVRVDELTTQLHNVLVNQQQTRNSYGSQPLRTDLSKPVETVQDSWLKKVYKVLEAHLDDPALNVEWLAGQMAMSRKTLLRKIQALTQLSPNELIRQFRLNKAADLLRAGHNVSETAYSVGFETPAYFGQCFKEYFQLTPTEFAHSSV